MKKPCRICGTETHSVCYKLYICAACTMFYRRNFKLIGVLKCRRLNQCNLKSSDRRICRACRLKECRNSGLRMVGKSLVVQHEGVPVDDVLEDTDCAEMPYLSIYPEQKDMPIVPRSVDSQDLSFSPQNLCSNNVISYVAIPSTSTNDFMQPHMQSALAFYSRHLTRNENILSDVGNTTKAVHIQSLEFQAKDSQFLSNAAVTVAEFLNGFMELRPNEKMELIKSVSPHLVIIDRLFRTCLNFPQYNDHCVSITTNMFLDLNNYASMISDLTNITSTKEIIDYYNQSKDFVQQFYSKISEVLTVFRAVNIDVVEFSVLFTAVILHKIEDTFKVGSAQEESDKLFNELGLYLSSKYGTSVHSRLIRVNALIYKVQELVNETNKLYDILTIIDRDQSIFCRPGIPFHQLQQIQQLISIKVEASVTVSPSFTPLITTVSADSH